MKKSSIIAIAIISIMLVSSMGLAVNFAAATTNQLDLCGNRPLQKSWVRLNGVIQTWGDDNVSGVLQTTARTTLLATDNSRQMTSATAMWTNSTSRPIDSIRTRENFTYVYYVARLNNASVSEFQLNGTNSNYFLNGTWSLYTITSNVTVITDENTIVSVHRDQDIKVSKAYGELNVTSNWTKFTLSIDNQNVLSGKIFRSITRQLEFNRCAIVDSSAFKTSRADLAKMVTCMHAVPGWGGYDSQMDFNGNFKVDIADLSTVAASI